MLSLTAAALYLIAAALCCGAAHTAGKSDRRRRNRAIWVAIAGLFVLLAASRVFDLENAVRAALRMRLAQEGEYGMRKSIQAPLAAALLAVGGLAGIALLLGLRPAAPDRAARAVTLAARCAVIMIGLVALRLVSLHATDALLYKPVHLNWLIDIGTTLAIAVCAWIYGRTAQPRHTARWPR